MKKDDCTLLVQWSAPWLDDDDDNEQEQESFDGGDSGEEDGERTSIDSYVVYLNNIRCVDLDL